MSEIFDCVEHTVPASHIRQYARSTSTHQEDVLHLAVKQYKPRYEVRDGDVTILACHASGFPKELYEPIWEELFTRAEKKTPGRRIRAIWSWDVVNQGQSGVLNEHKLGNEVSWYDHARDGLNLVNHFRSEMNRPLVGFGHSMGGCVVINMALIHPRLFASLVTVEPIINTTPIEMNFWAIPSIVSKNDKWPSKDTAMKYLSKIPLYAHWDPRIFDLFREYGLRSLPTANDPTGKGVTLTTSKHQEVFSFARPAYPKSRTQDLAEFVPDRAAYPDMGPDRAKANAFYRPESTITFQQLPFLRPSCLFLYGSRTHMHSAKAQGRADKLRTTGTGIGGSGGAAEGRVKEVVMKGSHFVPFETPEVLASLVNDWYDREVAIWTEREIEEMRAWQNVPHVERSVTDGELVFWAKKSLGDGGKNKAKL